MTKPAKPANAPFHHAYNFVPLPPRPAAGTPFGDGPPVGHDQLFPDLWNGRLRVRMTVRTPLIVGETRSKAGPDDPDAEAGHTYLQLRSRSGAQTGAHEGNDVEIPVTSIKGMLRGAYEIATLSRFGVSARHDVPLAFRSQPYEALELTPVRVEEIDGELHIRPLLGSRTKFGRVDGEHMPAALLPTEAAIKGFTWSRANPPHDDGFTRAHRFGHGVEVTIRLTSVHNGLYAYWVVTSIAERNQNPAAIGSIDNTTEEKNCVHGWVCRTNQVGGDKNFFSKKHERVFFNLTTPGPYPVKLTTPAIDAYREVLDSYVRELDGVPAGKQREKRRSASRPVVEWDAITKENRRGKKGGRTGSDGQPPLKPGDLLYGVFSADGRRLERLLPVMVGRRPFPKSPSELLGPTHRLPPTTFSEFSAADRVFGTVEQRTGTRDEDAVAYRGHLVISPVRPESVKIQRFGKEGLPLVELGAPKPAQARFYSAADPVGNPVRPGMLKADMYGEGSGLRGFKVFPRHRELEGKADEFVQKQVRAEATATTKLRSKRNASVTAWVRAGSTFTFDIDVTNMTEAELGALLWLVHPGELAVPRELEQSGEPAGFGVFRLGRGRPLGLGSVTLELLADGSSLVQGHTVTTAYRNLSGCLGAVTTESEARIDAERFTDVVKELIDMFRSATEEAVGTTTGFNGAPHIAALRRAATGYGDGVRVGYPKGSNQNRNGEDISPIVAWFQVNEKVNVPMVGRPRILAPGGNALPSLADSVTPLRDGNGIL